MTLTTELVISIPGHPAPKGSLKCVGGRGRHQLIEDNVKTKPWRDAVALWIRRNWHQHADEHQPLGADVTFSLPRPKYHYGTGKNAYILKDTAPPYPTKKAKDAGDADKLLRLILDAIQDTDVLPDDAQVIDVSARKRYAADNPPPGSDVLGYPGVVIRLYPL